jgi:hydroxymethylbilane synthase
VHSWKDLPIKPRTDTVIAGTLERADARDVLLIGRRTIDAEPSTLRVMTSSPRRAWQLSTSLRPLLPWPVSDVQTEDVRGNVPTRLNKALRDETAALVVAKAALDRLLGPDTIVDAGDEVRAVLTLCNWMVLPLRDFPTAPAQGALAIEVAATNHRVIDRVRAVSHEPTVRACQAERAILASHGGGCHEAIGATVLQRDYGTITSVRGHLPSGDQIERWSLDRIDTAPPPGSLGAIWPRPDERGRGARHREDVRFHWMSGRCGSQIKPCLTAPNLDVIRSCGRPARRRGRSWPLGCLGQRLRRRTGDEEGLTSIGWPANPSTGSA